MEEKKKILVVDDEEALCDGLGFNLEAEGYHVDTAYSAEEALARDLAGQRHADGNGDALAQRAGRHIDAGDVFHFHMAGHMAVDAAEHLQLLDREEAAQRQHRIHGGRAVALGHDEAVTLRVMRVLGIDVHLGKVQIRQHVHAAHRAARMAGFCEIRHLHDVGPQLLCFFLLQCKFHFLILRSLFSHGSA